MSLAKVKIIVLVVYVLILIIFSPEISFMPHYRHTPDKWHLILPSFVFYAVLIASLRWSWILMQRAHHIDYGFLTLMIGGMLAMAELNNPKGDHQVIGYAAVVILTFISAVVALRANRRPPEQ